MRALLDILQLLAAVATAVGVIVAARQLHMTKQQALTQFEDSLVSQYREIIRRLPVEALLGEPLEGVAYADALPHFYHYFDLSNEQAFLRGLGRISPKTWENWRDGIEQNLRRPAFARAWAEIGARAPESFDDLRRLLPAVSSPPHLPSRSVGAGMGTVTRAAASK